MVHTATRYAPHFTIQLFEWEMKTMKACADRHYDSRCKAAAQPGGIIFGFLNQFELSPPKTGFIEVELSRADVGLLLKVLEGEPESVMIRTGLHSLMKKNDLHTTESFE